MQSTRLLHPWDFQARVLEWGAIALSINNNVRMLQLWVRKLRAWRGSRTFPRSCCLDAEYYPLTDPLPVSSPLFAVPQEVHLAGPHQRALC